ncbi:hypothetical protein MUP50_00145, partial [Patescibacteria group bacterium]|nr:hypothetical protein [Patescibacteria group bacterium]
TIGKGEGFGPWAKAAATLTETGNPGIILANILTNILGVMTIGAGIWFLFQAIIAGYNYMNAAGDKTRIENAGRKLTNSLVGIAIVVAAYGLIAILGTFLGVKFLELGAIFDIISPK